MTDDSRAKFEKIISAIPYQYSVNRYGLAENPMGYIDDRTHLAWELWQKARRLERDRCREIIKKLWPRVERVLLKEIGE